MLRRRAPNPPPSDLMDVEDMEPAHVDSGVFQPEQFEQDAENDALDSLEWDDNCRECQLCAILDDPYNNENAETARHILDFERCNHGRIADNTLFTQIAVCFNKEVVEPAQRLADRSPNLQIEVPALWNRLMVKRHFTICKQMTRRKLARLVEQGERLLELVYRGCRVRNPVTGEVKADLAATRSYFQHASVYSQMLIKSKPILEPVQDSLTGGSFAKKAQANAQHTIWKTMA